MLPLRTNRRIRFKVCVFKAVTSLETIWEFSQVFDAQIMITYIYIFYLFLT